MQKDIVSAVEKANKQFIEAVRRLSEINLRTVEKLAERQIAGAALYLEGGVKQLELLTGAKDAQSVVGEQTKLVAELNEKLVDHAKRTAEVLVEAKDELTEWAQEGFKQAQAAAQSAAPVKKAA